MDDRLIKRQQFTRITQPLTELELLFKNAFEEFYQNAKVELIRIQEPYVFEENDYLNISYVYSSVGDLDNTIRCRYEFFSLLQSKLSEINEERYPLTSFIEYDDFMENAPKELLA